MADNCESRTRRMPPGQIQMKRRPYFAGRTRSFFCAAGLFLVNVYICRELFRTEYLNQMGSIEAAFIGLARYVRDNFTDLAWFPLWYGGVP